MGTGTAGLDAQIYVKDDSSSFGSIANAKNGTAVQGATSISFTAGKENLDYTDFSDEGFDQNDEGLENPQVSIDANFDGSDTSGQKILLDSRTNDLANKLHVAVLPDESGSIGFEAQMVHDSGSPEVSSEVDGKSTISYSLVPEGGSGFSVIT